MKVTSVLAVALMFGSLSSAAESPRTISLALNWKPEPQFGGFYAAQVAKLDRKNGIDLQILPGGSGTPVVQVVAAGKVDFGIASADEVLLSRAKGSDVVALFAVYQKNPQAIMVRKARGFRSLAEVFSNEGTLAMQKGLPYAVFLQRRYAEGMKVRAVPYGGGISNFLTDGMHAQQCFVTSEPLLARAKGIDVSTFLVAESGYNPYTTVVITRSSVLKARSNEVLTLVRTAREGWQMYLNDEKTTSATHAIMNRLNPSLDLKTLSESARVQKELIVPIKDMDLGQMELARWGALQDQLFDLGLLKSKMRAEDFFANISDR